MIHPSDDSLHEIAEAIFLGLKSQPETTRVNAWAADSLDELDPDIRKSFLGNARRILHKIENIARHDDGVYPSIDKQIENLCVTTLVDELLAKGYTITVAPDCLDIDEYEVIKSTSSPAILRALNSTGGDVLLLSRSDCDERFVHLVYGNEPFEVIADHTDTPEVNDAVEAAELRIKTWTK